MFNLFRLFQRMSMPSVYKGLVTAENKCESYFFTILVISWNTLSMKSANITMVSVSAIIIFIFSRCPNISMQETYFSVFFIHLLLWSAKNGQPKARWSSSSTHPEMQNLHTLSSNFSPKYMPVRTLSHCYQKDKQSQKTIQQL